MKRKQYKSLSDLQEAYKTGELNADESRLILDNDESYVYTTNSRGQSKCVFSDGGKADLIGEALDLLGIPWDNC